MRSDDVDDGALRPPLNEAERAVRERVRGHVRMLAHVIGPRHMNAPPTMDTTAAYIERELALAAARAVQRHQFPVGTNSADNLIAEWPGARRPGQVVVVGAHYDTVPESPGADDNASAVAMLIEIARLLADHEPGRTLRLVAFANEEAPHHNMGTMGSDHYAQRCLAEQRDGGPRVTAMLSLEMVGYYRTQPGSQRIPPVLPRAAGVVMPRRGDFLAAVANLRSIPLLLRFRRGFRRRRPVGGANAGARFPLFPIALPEAVRDITRSDHRPFWEAGIQALMITDTSYLRNPHYHEPTDTPDTLDYDRLARATLATANAVVEMGG